METPNRHNDFKTHDYPGHSSSSPPRRHVAIEEKFKTITVVDEKESTYNIDDNPLKDDSNPAYRNGEPVITTGQDVSRFVVDIRDDEDPALTFRSMFLGTLFAGMGAALSQVSIIPNECCWQYLPSPIDIHVQASADVSLQGLLTSFNLYRR